MRLNDAVIGIVLAALAAAVLVHASTFPTLPNQPYGPATFPTILAIALGACAVVLVVRGVRDRAPIVSVAAWLAGPSALARFASVPAFVVLYILATPTLGFPIVAPVLLFAMTWLLDGRPVRALVVAAVASAAIWYAFAELLRVPLPLGVLRDVIY